MLLVGGQVVYPCVTLGIAKLEVKYCKAFNATAKTTRSSGSANSPFPIENTIHTAITVIAKLQVFFDEAAAARIATYYCIPARDRKVTWTNARGGIAARVSLADIKFHVAVVTVKDATWID